MERDIPIRCWPAGLTILLLVVSWASGQDWAHDMFKGTSHDFGTVARGAKVEHRFVLENIYQEDAHIASARVSCGCTTPEVPTQILKTWDKGEVIAKVDTRGYLGQKDVTITVTFDKPFPAEVQLQIHCYIRSDVVVQPGVVQFGSVTQGAGGRQKVAISYAGRSDWQIRRVECANPNLSAQVIETARGGGLVNYELTATLAPGAAPGYIRDEFYLITNDINPRAARVPVPVEGVVQAGISVSPSPLYMGTVEVGKPISRQLVVYGAAPFRIVQVDSSNPRFQCRPPAASATMHRLPITFQAGDSVGTVYGQIRIQTDGGVSLPEVSVRADVVPATASPAKPPPETKTAPAQNARTPAGRPAPTGREL